MTTKKNPKDVSTTNPETPIAHIDWVVAALTRGGIGLWRWDIEKDVVTRTDNSYLLMGMQRDRLGEGLAGFLSTVHPDDRAHCERVVQNALESGTDYRIEFRIPQKDGSSKWIEGVAQIIRDESGKALAIEGAIYDITSRVLAEQELAKTHSDYQRIVSAAGLVVYHHDLLADEYRQTNLSILEDIVGAPYRGSHSEFWKSVKLLASQPMGELAGLSQQEAVAKYRSGNIDVWRAEYKIQRADEQIRWIYDFAYAVRNSANEIIASFGILQDVTELRRITETISRIVSRTSGIGDEYLQQLTYALSEALEVKYAFIGEFVEGGSTCARMVASAEDGRPIGNITYEVKGTPCEMVYEEGVCFYRDNVQEAFPDDHMLVDIGAYAYLGAPLKSSTGQPIGLIVVLHTGPINEALHPADVLQLFASHAAAEIERRRVEAELRESESFYRSLIKVQSEGIMVHDENDRILTSNLTAQRILRASESELCGLSSRDFKMIHPDGSLWDPAETPSALAIATGEPQEGRVLGLRWEDGSTTWISINAMPINYPGGAGNRHVVISFADITSKLDAEAQLKRLNTDLEALVNERTEDLQRANRELESFAYSVSHDLRQPLRAIDGFSRILEMDYGDKLDDEAKQHIDTIRSATRRMSTLIDDLLRLSRLISHDLVPTTVDLSRLAQEVLATLQAGNGEHSVEIDIQPNLAAVGDESLLRAVFDNLLQNALKFSARKDHSIIQVGKEEEAFFVRDNGCGFDMQYYNKLFEPFQRLHGRDEFEGTGIGLATVQRIIERHKGKVWAESELDKGTTVYFTLNGEAAARQS